MSSKDIPLTLTEVATQLDGKRLGRNHRQELAQNMPKPPRRSPLHHHVSESFVAYFLSDELDDYLVQNTSACTLEEQRPHERIVVDGGNESHDLYVADNEAVAVKAISSPSFTADIHGMDCQSDFSIVVDVNGFLERGDRITFHVAKSPDDTTSGEISHLCVETPTYLRPKPFLEDYSEFSVASDVDNNLDS